jgi:CheY-like chemotaxis protein
MNNPKKRILVVDDESSITRLLKINLENTGEYEVRTENSATHALAAAREFHPQLILLDLLMPEVDGGNLASRFQASPEFKNIPIVFLTAVVTKTEVIRNAGVIGGLPFLAKPVDTADVIRCLKRHLPSDAAVPPMKPVTSTGANLGAGTNPSA